MKGHKVVRPAELSCCVTRHHIVANEILTAVAGELIPAAL